jgi:anti-anti-sigma factor
MMATEHATEVCVTISGGLTVRNAAETVATVLADWEEHGRPNRVVLDLSSVHRIDSSGVGALMEIRHRLDEASAQLVLRGLEEGPRRVLDRTGIARLFDIRDSAAAVPAPRFLVPTPRKRGRRALWAMLWLCLIVGVLAGIAVASYPTIQRAHAQLEQVPVLGTLMSAMDQRVGEMEQSFKDQFGALESRLTAHIRSEKRQQAENAKRTAQIQSRVDAIEAAQRETGARIDALQQKLEQTQQTPKEDK